jgi:hypothetical protein
MTDGQHRWLEDEADRHGPMVEAEYSPIEDSVSVPEVMAEEKETGLETVHYPASALGNSGLAKLCSSSRASWKPA